MNARNGNPAPKGRRGWWADPPRSGLRRIIAPWEYRHLRFFARQRLVAAIILVGLGVVTLSCGGNDLAAFAWAAAFTAAGAAQCAVAYWFLSIARSESRRA